MSDATLQLFIERSIVNSAVWHPIESTYLIHVCPVQREKYIYMPNLKYLGDIVITRIFLEAYRRTDR